MTEVEVLEKSEVSHIPNLGEMTWLFLKLGSIGFGGGIAMIALMEDEFIKRRKCFPAEEFLHGVALSQILGSFPVNTALFIGHRLHGFVGSILGSMAFLAPSLFMVLFLSWLYFSFQQIPSLQGVLQGLSPVVIGIILTAAWSMGQKAIKGYITWGLGIAGCIATLTQINPVLILGVAGLVGWLLKLAKPPAVKQEHPQAIVALPVAMQTLPHQGVATAPAVIASNVDWWLLTLTFLKVGIVFFGGGFVLIPVLKQLLIDQLHWLTTQEFIDGVAISQLTPGPIAVIATFAGFRVGGLVGAFLATFGLFLPSLGLMSMLSMYYQKFKHLQGVKHFLAGVNPAVVGMIVSAAINLVPNVFVLSAPVRLGINGALLLMTLVFIVKLKWHPALSLAIGAIVGGVLSYLAV